MLIESGIERHRRLARLRKGIVDLAESFGASQAELQDAILELLTSFEAEAPEVSEPSRNAAQETAPAKAVTTPGVTEVNGVTVKGFSGVAYRLICQNPGIKHEALAPQVYPNESSADAKEKTRQLLHFLEHRREIVSERNGGWYPKENPQPAPNGSSRTRHRRADPESLQSMVIAAVRNNSGPMPSADIVSAIQQQRPEAIDRSIYGAASRLAQEGKLQQEMRGRLAYYSLPNGQ